MENSVFWRLNQEWTIVLLSELRPKYNFRLLFDEFDLKIELFGCDLMEGGDWFEEVVCLGRLLKWAFGGLLCF